MSGPGLLAIEELAQDSGCDIYLHDIRLHDEMVANVEMPNPTSGTNGAIIIACLESIALQVVEALKEAGYAPWVMGRVIRKSERPTIHINRALEKYPFIKGVHKGIFGRYEFCEPQL
jgi:selenophosphate synthase